MIYSGADKNPRLIYILIHTFALALYAEKC